MPLIMESACRSAGICMFGLNQREFSSLVGVSKNTESNWENGYYEPNETRWKIIKALPDLKLDTNEELQLSFLKILPLCPRCRKLVEDYIRYLYKLLRKRMAGIANH